MAASDNNTSILVEVYNRTKGRILLAGMYTHPLKVNTFSHFVFKNNPELCLKLADHFNHGRVTVSVNGTVLNYEQIKLLWSYTQNSTGVIIQQGGSPVGNGATTINFDGDGVAVTSPEPGKIRVNVSESIVPVTRSRGEGTVTIDIPANTNITGAGGSPNLDAQLPDHSGVVFATHVDAYYNGDLVSKDSVYAGDVPANGDIKLTFALSYREGTNPDVLTLMVWK